MSDDALRWAEMEREWSQVQHEREAKLRAENEVLLATVKELENTEHGEIERLRALLERSVKLFQDIAKDDDGCFSWLTEARAALADQGKG